MIKITEVCLFIFALFHVDFQQPLQNAKPINDEYP